MANKQGSPLIPTLTVGGRVFTDLSNLKILQTQLDGNTSNTRYSNFVLNGAAYQVTAGKTLTIYAVEVMLDNAFASPLGVGFLSGTNALGFSSTTAPTGAAWHLGSSPSWGLAAIPSNNTAQQKALSWAAAAGTYLYAAIQPTSALCELVITAFGYEA